MAAKTGTFGIGGPGTGPGHFTKWTHVWIPAEVAAAAAAGPPIEEVLAEMDAEAAAEKAEKAEKAAYPPAYKRNVKPARRRAY